MLSSSYSLCVYCQRVDLSLRFTNCPHLLALRWDLNLFVTLPSYQLGTDDNEYEGWYLGLLPRTPTLPPVLLAVVDLLCQLDSLATQGTALPSPPPPDTSGFPDNLILRFERLL
jgi:hypothetical protein